MDEEKQQINVPEKPFEKTYQQLQPYLSMRAPLDSNFSGIEETETSKKIQTLQKQVKQLQLKTDRLFENIKNIHKENQDLAKETHKDEVPSVETSDTSFVKKLCYEIKSRVESFVKDNSSPKGPSR